MLLDLIQSVADWQNKTAEEIYAELSAPSILIEDKELYTWAGIATVCGDEAASALCSKLIEFGKVWAVHQLGGKGLDLSNEDIQQQLYYLDSIGVPNMALLAQHVKKAVSPLQQMGIETTPPEIEVVKRKKILEDAAIDRLQVYREALSSWDGNVETEPVL